jgi:ABC-type bacteriocin/lantibiotic exporter with double-glycine peptidase domain
MKLIYKLLIKFLKEEKINTILIVLISCLISFFKINVISYISSNIIKSIQENELDKVYKFYKYFIIITVIYLILYYFYKVIQNELLSKLKHWLRFDLMKLLMLSNNENLSNINFTKLNTPIFRITNNCMHIFSSFITSFIPNISILLIIASFFLYKDFLFGFIFLVGNFIFLLYFYFNFNEIYIKNQIYEKNTLTNESYIVEILQNIDKIIFRGKINDEINNLSDKTKIIYDNGHNFYTTVNNKMFIIHLIIYFTIFILLIYLINLYSNKKINSIIFITFLTILLLYRDLILNFVVMLTDYIEYIGIIQSTHSYIDNIDYENINKDLKISNEKLNFNTIEFNNINFKYKKGHKKIYDNFNKKINIDNKIIGLVGLSGNGKSTFAKLLIKMYKYDGTILIDNIDIKNINTEYLRKNIIYVNQNSKLFDEIIIKNIIYGCDNNTEYCNKYLIEIMKFTKIKDLFKNIDFETTKAGLGGENLSGGQRQIINLINGLIIPSEIIILDEPTNALDPELKNDVIQLIKHFKKYKKCIIVISHDKDVFSIFDEKIEI